MDVIYGLIPFVLGIGFLVVLAFFWAARSGQFDDLDGEASRILVDDDDEFEPVAPRFSPSKEEKTSVKED